MASVYYVENFIGQVLGKGSDMELGSQAGKCISQDGLSNATVTMFYVLLFCHTSSPVSATLLVL